MIRLVPHGSRDYEKTLDLRRRVLRWPLGLDFSESDLEAEVGDFHLAAFDGDAVVGCLVLTPTSNGAIKMRQVAVEPALQGKGLGRLMVEESERVAVENGFRTMILNARDTAVPFYRRLGYEPVGEPFEEVTIPHQKMTKELV